MHTHKHTPTRGVICCVLWEMRVAWVPPLQLPCPAFCHLWGPLETCPLASWPSTDIVSPDIGWPPGLVLLRHEPLHNGRHLENIIYSIRLREMWVCYSWSGQWLPGQQGSIFSGPYPGSKVITEGLHSWHFVSDKISPKSTILLNASWSGPCGKWYTVTTTMCPPLSPHGFECARVQLWGDQVRFARSASFQQGMWPQHITLSFMPFLILLIVRLGAS
jgi:hypothetical protein